MCSRRIPGQSPGHASCGPSFHLRVLLCIRHPRCSPSVILDACPRRLSPTFVIGDPIKDLSGIQSKKGSSVFVVGSCLWSLHSYPRHHMAPPQGACGHGCAPVPNSSWRRGLSERSEFRSPSNRDCGKGTQRATPGRPWFWVLLPKQKDLGVRGRNPASTSPFLSSSTLVIEDPGFFL